MAKVEPVYQFFNVGQVDADKTHLTQIDRVRLAAEQQTNLLGTVTGSMFVRPGFEYIGGIDGNNKTRLFNYYRSDTEKAVLEFTDQKMRVWVGDALVTRPSVSSTITNPNFDTGGGGWTLSSGAAMVTGDGLYLNANVYIKGQKQSASQLVSTSTPGVEHGLRIDITQGPVTLYVENGDGTAIYIPATELNTGLHSIAFTPGSTYKIFLRTNTEAQKSVKSVNVDASGVIELATPWAEADLALMRFDTSLDVVFVGKKGERQRRIERRGNTSWSVAYYDVKDGPFSVIKPTDDRLTVDPGWGARTISTSGSALFDPNAVGGLIRTHVPRRKRTEWLGAENTYTEPFRVTGVNATNYNDRDFTYTVSGTFSGTVRTYRSFDGETSGFRPFRRAQGVATIDITGAESPISFTNDDDDDNAIVWYKFGFGEGSYTSGSAVLTYDYDGDDAVNIAQITSVIATTITTTANIVYLKFENDNEQTTDDWEVGDWGFITDWPGAVALHDGRLFWSGDDRLWGSVSDAFNSFDDEFEGDAGPILRAIATGGSNDAQWMMSLAELVIGTNTGVVSAKASDLGEVLTPSDTTIKEIEGSVPCAAVSPVRVGNEGMFVDATTTAIHLLAWGGAGYVAQEISKLSTELFSSGIVELAYQTRPDPRIWAVTGDGDVVCILYDRKNDILGFFPITTDGDVESLVVQPGTGQDRVYAAIKRTINGATVRYFEKMATDADARPITLAKVSDAFVTATASGTTLTVGSHLEGEDVVVWANGAPIFEDGSAKLFTVTSGDITLPAANSGQQCVAGLPYPATRYKSARLAHGVEGYNAFTTKKRIVDLGLEMTDFVRSAVKFGGEFDNADHPLNGLPVYDAQENVAPDVVLGTSSPEQPFPVESTFNYDSRLCIEVEPGCPARFLVMSMNIEVSA